MYSIRALYCPSVDVIPPLALATRAAMGGGWGVAKSHETEERRPIVETITVYTQTAIKYEVEVTETGHVELEVPFPPGSRVTIFVVEETVDNFSDLLAASQSSLDFWDNPYDDEDWSMMLTTYKELACTA